MFFWGTRGLVAGLLTLRNGGGTHPLPPLFEGKRGGETRGLVAKQKNANTTPCRRSISE